ncbi:EARP and GARP complex-interacting protein 1 isoform X5 [Accipiter gentilis]|uniref:EARP and GARP complex-interacting protein 1 isoform X5 n=1 Tax=Astur gentilis TaxID=8957 RepID=UPI00210FF1B8|nr:EARP and GARP complex-interacting protein 1 isoform X5 [Accipiter gentilis]
MEDDAPVIYGLEFQARALTPQTAETDAIRFLVGTQSLRYDNQIHIIDFDDENNIINKNVLLHQVGEIWHISTSPADKGVLATCYNKTSDSKVMTCAAVWRMPKELESGSHESPDDSSSNTQTLELLCHLDNTAHGNMACIMWEPMGDGKKIISLADNNILLWDLQESSAKAVLSSSTALEGKGQLKFTSGRWSPHHNCTQIATANDTTVRGWDTRSMRVWNVRYNHSHDQLILTGSSDSRVILSNMVSISSEPFGHMVDDDELSDQEDQHQEEKKKFKVLNSPPCSKTCQRSADYPSIQSTLNAFLFCVLCYASNVRRQVTWALSSGVGNYEMGSFRDKNNAHESTAVFF